MSEQEKKGTYLAGKKFTCTPVRSHIQPVYKLSRPDANRNRQLVQTGERDLQELVQSNYVNSFDYILDRFLDAGMTPEQIAEQAGSAEFDQDFLIDTLMLNTEYVEAMEEAREVFGLSPDLTYSQIRDELQSKLDEMKKGGVNLGQTQETPQTPDQTPEIVEQETQPEAVS